MTHKLISCLRTGYPLIARTRVQICSSAATSASMTGWRTWRVNQVAQTTELSCVDRIPPLDVHITGIESIT